MTSLGASFDVIPCGTGRDYFVIVLLNPKCETFSFNRILLEGLSFSRRPSGNLIVLLTLPKLCLMAKLVLPD